MEQVMPQGRLWCRHVNEPQSEAELVAIQSRIARGRPFGGDVWREKVSRQLGLQHTFRPRSRPKETEAINPPAERPKK